MSARQFAEAPCAVGRPAPDSWWVGFQRADDGYRFVVGFEGEVRAAEADLDLLLALAIAYFTEAFEGAPPDLEATQADLSALVAHLAECEADPGRGKLLTEALDAIDDGLAGDEVASRLTAARPLRAELVDPVELLVMRGRELAGRA